LTTLVVKKFNADRGLQGNGTWSVNHRHPGQICVGANIIELIDSPGDIV
jgi:hypothetical protein